jgi:hypothetical protein
MERLRVGLAAMVLLLGGVGQSRADYLFPSRISDPGGAGQLSYPPDVAVPPSGSVLIAEALNHHVQVFVSAGVFVTRFGNRSSGYAQIFEPGEAASASLLDPLTWPSSTHSTLFMDPDSFGTHGEQVSYAFGNHSVAVADMFVVESFHRGRETSSSSDPFLASIGLTLGETQPAEPSRVIIVEPPPSMLSNRKILLSVIVLAIGGFVTAGFVWRQRKHSSYRTPGRRRPIWPYRSTGLPNPRGTISSPPP